MLQAISVIQPKEGEDKPYAQLQIGFKKEEMEPVRSEPLVSAESNMSESTPTVLDKKDSLHADVHKVISVLRFLPKRINALGMQTDSDFCTDLYIHLAAKTDEFKRVLSKLCEKHNQTYFKSVVDEIEDIQNS